ncbi:hypothetical protein WI98_03570 [Burkholderia vietnamiensis]|nr:hypothetical protein WI98_03570 [Burkholderia vietnamiensis]
MLRAAERGRLVEQRRREACERVRDYAGLVGACARVAGAGFVSGHGYWPAPTGAAASDGSATDIRGN